MNEKILKINNCRKIFPEKFTKVRSEDLVVKSFDKNLSKKEAKKLLELSGEIRGGKIGGENQDILATRNGKKIKFEPLFDKDE